MKIIHQMYVALKTSTMLRSAVLTNKKVKFCFKIFYVSNNILVLVLLRYFLSSQQRFCTVIDEGLHLSPVLSDTNVSSPSSGKVELFLQQAFGQICSTYFTEKEANVTCRQLGFSGGVPMVYGAAETLPFLLTGLHCSGDEDKISDCYKETQICYSNQRAGVLCYNTTGTCSCICCNQPCSYLRIIYFLVIIIYM